MGNKTAHVVVLGAGFGGLTFCQNLCHPNARITVVDRHNHHLFQPLLYQVATAGLSPAEIAQPIRSILSDQQNVTVLLDEVMEVKLDAREVVLRRQTLQYDYLIIALGGRTTYFGHPEWEQFAPGLKSIEDAVRIRRDVLLAFERAEQEQSEAERQRLLTMVVVGGGPTGVELAGAFAELARYVLRKDFRHIDPATARVILIEASPCVLSNLHPDSSASAERQLRRLGVEIRTNVKVQNIEAGVVELTTGERISAATILWAAGVGASTVTKSLGVELDRAGRVRVSPDLSVPGRPEVFAIGDLASLMQKDGTPVPGVSPAAMQMAKHVAAIIRDELDAPASATRPVFSYFDKGTMATIGRSAAVADVRGIRFDGWFAWLAWLFVHLIFLVGFRSKIAVLIQWAYSYFAYKRGARLITDVAPITQPGADVAPKTMASPAAQPGAQHVTT
jgi:NADH:ubiquinone reductase (H+-translocating)